MASRHSPRWRWRLKSALASTISRAHEYGVVAPLARGANRPLILGYHRVVDDYAAAAQTAMSSMLISTAMFERHLDYIGRRFTFVGLDEIGDHLLSGTPFERPVAAVTFDDGYRDVYEHAYPVLKRKGIPAAVFVVTDLVGKPFWQVHDKLYHLVAKAFAMWDDPRRELETLFSALDLPCGRVPRHRDAIKNPLLAVSSILPALTLADVRRLMDGLDMSVGNGFHPIPVTIGWAELADMQTGGITVGSHTRNHVSLPMEAPEVVAEELNTSKRHLEARLGHPIRHFAYPGGQFTPAVIDAVAGAGYQFAYTACRHSDSRHPALTIERLLLWEGSSVDADGRFSPAILNCQVQDLWLPSRRCGRVHSVNGVAHG